MEKLVQGGADCITAKVLPAMVAVPVRDSSAEFLPRPLPRRAAVALLGGEGHAFCRDEGRVGTSPRHELDLGVELPEVRLEVERDLPERGVCLRRRSGLFTGSLGWSRRDGQRPTQRRYREEHGQGQPDRSEECAGAPPGQRKESAHDEMSGH